MNHNRLPHVKKISAFITFYGLVSEYKKKKKKNEGRKLMKSSRTEAVSIITLPQGSSQPNPPSLYSPRFMILKLQFKLGLPLNFSTRLIQVSMGPISGDLMLPMDVFLEYFSRLIPSSQYPGFFFSWLPPSPPFFSRPRLFSLLGYLPTSQRELRNGFLLDTLKLKT